MPCIYVLICLWAKAFWHGTDSTQVCCKTRWSPLWPEFIGWLSLAAVHPFHVSKCTVQLMLFSLCSEQSKIRDNCFTKPSWPPLSPVPSTFCHHFRIVVWVRIRTFYMILCRQYWRPMSQSRSALWSHGRPVGWNKNVFSVGHGTTV